MDSLKLKLDKDTYQYLKLKFNGDVNEMEDFAKNILTQQVDKERLKKNKDKDKDKDKENINNENLEKYLKSSKPGSRSYGIKGQGW